MNNKIKDLELKIKQKEEKIVDLDSKLEQKNIIQNHNYQYISTLEQMLNQKEEKIENLLDERKKYHFYPVNNENKSKKGKFIEKFLNKSNSYVFYKENYNKLVKINNSDKKELKNKNSQITHLKDDIATLKNDLNIKLEELRYLQKNMDKNLSKINSLEDELEEKNTLIDVLESRLEYNYNKFNIFNDAKKINIAYVLNGFPNHSETFVVNEIRWLKQNGYNIIVFKRQDPFKSINLDFDIKILCYTNDLELETLLIENNIDLMHTHFVYPICTNYTFPIAERLKIPFTVFAHAYDIFTNTSVENNNVKAISESKFCKAIFTLSDFHKDYLLKQGVLEEKIVITKQATSYELAPISEKKNKLKKIISISRFVEKKGLDVLIDAAKLLEGHDFEFSIYGFGALEEKLQNQIQDLGCSNISIKGELHPDEVKNKLKEADLLVAPCKVAKNGDMDGFPTVIFEAMAVGLPVLTTSVSAIPEIIEDGVNGFIIDPENPEMLSEKIKELSQIPNEKLFEIRKQAQNDVKNISSVDKTMEVYIKTIKNSFE